MDGCVTVYNIADFGAVSGGDPAINRDAFTAAIAASTGGASDLIQVPVGTFEVTPLGSAAYSILANKPDLTFEGVSRTGSIVAMTAADAIELAANRVFKLEANRVTIRRLTLEGNKPNRNTVTVYVPTTIEQHAGFFAGPNIEDPTVEECDIRNFTGDGGVFYLGCRRPTFRNNFVEYTQRNGITFNPSYNHETQEANPVFDARVYGNTFQHVTVQPIDNEHGPVHGNEIYGNRFLSPGFQSYAITCSGYSDVLGHNSRSTGWIIHNNYFEQGMFLIRCDDVDVYNNEFLNPTTKPCVEMSRSTNRINIWGNDMINTQLLAASVASVRMAGTSEEGAAAREIRVWRNRMVLAHPQSYGVYGSGFHSIEVFSNDIIGPGISNVSSAGIFVRSTVVGRPVESALVYGNKVSNFGRYGLLVQGLGGSTTLINNLQATRNYFFNTVGITSQSIGMSLGYVASPLDEPVQAMAVNKNRIGDGVVTDATNVPTGPSYTFAASTPLVGGEDVNLMSTVIIGGITYEIYGSLDVDDPGPPDPDGVLSADTYLNGMIGTDAWAAASDTTRQRCLVSATAYLERLTWAGSKTVAAQPLQWPRTGVTVNGSAVDSTVYPQAIVYACYELAFIYLTKPKSLDTSQGGAGNIKRLKAGSAEIEYFVPTDANGIPLPVAALIGPYTGYAATAEGQTEVFGDDAESQFDDADRYTVNLE